MRGVGRSSAAISIVNALPTGIGCAHGVRLYAAVSVEMTGASTPSIIIEPETSRTRLVVRSLEHAVARFGPGQAYQVHAEVDSEIPVGKGLKSSSAVATASIRAVADALGRPTEPPEVARLAAEVGREVGVSATGAFDDALAGLVPGFVLTDNRSCALLDRRPAPTDWVAVVHAPDGTHPAPPTVWGRFRAYAHEGEPAVHAAQKGAWAEAMATNSVLVERVMGYDYGPLRNRLMAAGAAGASVSGLGPALVALTPRSRGPAVLEALPEPRFLVPLTSEAHP
jgi:shikimate kinase